MDPCHIDHEVIVVGAGFGGLATAIKLREAGIDDVILLEQADDVGGTWRVNTYPGVAVDVPSFLYQFSFEIKHDWSRVFAKGEEIKAYIDEIVDRHELRPRIRFGVEVTAMDYDEDNAVWRISSSAGELVARFAVNATGVFSKPKPPAIAGLDSFEGKTIHSTAWDHDHDLGGERVAVIGTGATAVQLVPELARSVGQLHVYQRTPIWIFPKTDPKLDRAGPVFERLPILELALRWAVGAISEGVMIGASYHRQLPFLTRAIQRASKAHLRRQVFGDPDLIERLTPGYSFGCKRPAVSNHYWRAFTRENVELVTEPIAAITPTGIRSADGSEREIDTLVLATGFLTTEPETMPPFPVRGRGGKELGSFWRSERFQAYEGASVPGYPNLFHLFGPYAFSGLSYLAMIENQAIHAGRVITEARRRGTLSAEVRQEPHDRFFEKMLKRQPDTVFFDGCDTANSYYLDSRGDAPLLRPGSTIETWWRARHFDLDDYDYGRPSAAASAEQTRSTAASESPGKNGSASALAEVSSATGN